MGWMLVRLDLLEVALFKSLESLDCLIKEWLRDRKLLLALIFDTVSDLLLSLGFLGLSINDLFDSEDFL